MALCLSPCCVWRGVLILGVMPDGNKNTGLSPCCVWRGVLIYHQNKLVYVYNSLSPCCVWRGVLILSSKAAGGRRVVLVRVVFGEGF